MTSKKKAPLEIKYIKPALLKPDKGNPRNNDKAVGPVKQSIEHFGFVNPIIARKSDKTIIAGHTRLKASIQAGLETVPVIFVDMSDADADLFNVADNKLAEIADWEYEMLADRLKEWDLLNMDISLTGFEQDEITAILEMVEPPPDHNGSEDDTPLPPEVAVSKPGDVWLLGNHRLICGDSTVPAVIDRLTAGRPIEMIWTDPPYNVNYKTANARDGKSSKPILNDNMPSENFRAFLTDMFTNAARHLVKGGPYYIMHADGERDNVQAAILRAGLEHKQTLIWMKNIFVLSRQDYNWRHEPIMYGWKPGAAHRWYGEFNKSTLVHQDGPEVLKKMTKAELITLVTDLVAEAPTDVIEIDRPMKSELHPTMKPVALVEKMILNGSRQGQVVYDPCGGSGTTLIACETTKRHCRTAELDPLYCDVIKTRWEHYTGLEAELE